LIADFKLQILNRNVFKQKQPLAIASG